MTARWRIRSKKHGEALLGVANLHSFANDSRAVCLAPPYWTRLLNLGTAVQRRRLPRAVGPYTTRNLKRAFEVPICMVDVAALQVQQAEVPYATASSMGSCTISAMHSAARKVLFRLVHPVLNRARLPEATQRLTARPQVARWRRTLWMDDTPASLRARPRPWRRHPASKYTVPQAEQAIRDARLVAEPALERE